MTMPLKKDRTDGEAIDEMVPKSDSTLETDEELERKGPQPVRSESMGNAPVRSESMGNAGEMTLPKDQGNGDATPLLMEKDRQELQRRWDQVQTGFVDQPRDAVHEADALVSSAIDRLSKSFADERSRLEQQWDKGDSVSTEDLRVALQRYRSFFHRMLAV